ncbi:MAG: MFS transporter [Chloroflexota bacterium]|nr:MFS transporter [Chloroflexota bacterium]
MTAAFEARTAPRQDATRALVAVFLAVFFASGSRFAFTAFVVPLEAALGVDRATIGLAAALSLVAYGVAQPFSARLGERVAPAIVMLGGLALMAVSAIGMALARTELALFVFGGLLPGIGFAAASIVPASAILAPLFPRRTGFALGVASAAIPAGQALAVPLAASLIGSSGWPLAYAAIGVGALLLGAPGLLGLARTAAPAAMPRRGATTADATFWLLAVGFSACGFTDQLVAVHAVPLAEDAGVAPLVAALALSALTLVAIAGSLASGPLADGWSDAGVLAVVYGGRAVTLPLLLFVGTLGGLPLWIFAVAFGLTYISNNAPAAGALARTRGPAAVAAALGWLQFAHQMGGALGVAAGGVSVSLTGGYLAAIALAVALALAGLAASLGLRRVLA